MAGSGLLRYDDPHPKKRTASTRARLRSTRLALPPLDNRRGNKQPPTTMLIHGEPPWFSLQHIEHLGRKSSPFNALETRSDSPPGRWVEVLGRIQY